MSSAWVVRDSFPGKVTQAGNKVGEQEEDFQANEAKIAVKT